MSITKEKIIIVGKYKGFGGVQTIHKNIFNHYKKQNYEVFLIYSLKEYISYLIRNKFNHNIKIVFFSGLSLFFSPLFICKAKHIFFTHGFYIYEGFDSKQRFFKKKIYEFCIKSILKLYKWVYCISPSPTSSLVNSISFSRKVYTLPWGVSDEFINFPIKTNIHKYHLVFLGRPNTQKLQIPTIRFIINLLKSQKIVSNTEDICFAFLVPNINNHLKFVQNTLAEEYGCSIKTFIRLNNLKVAKILSQSLYSFNCFEWEAYGLSYIESLCMGCNVLLPNTSPIIPIIDNYNDGSISKFTTEKIPYKTSNLDKLRLRKERMPLKSINYYRSIFKWEDTINNIDKLITNF